MTNNTLRMCVKKNITMLLPMPPSHPQPPSHPHIIPPPPIFTYADASSVQSIVSSVVICILVAANASV